MFKKIFPSFSINSTRANFAWATVLQVVEKGAGYVVLAVLTRTLLKADLGTMFYALSISDLVAVLLNFGTDTYLIRKVAIDPQNSLNHLSKILSIRCVTVTVGYGVLNFAVWQWMPDLLPVMLLASAHDFLEEIGQTFQSFFSGKRQVVYRLVMVGGFKLIMMVGIVVIALTYQALIPVLLGYVGLSALFVLACFWVIRQRFGRINMKWEPQISSSILRTSLPFFLANVLTTMHMRFDTIMVGAMLNVREVANYELGIKLVEVARFLVRPLNIVFLPVFSEYFLHLQQKKLRIRFLLLTLLMLIMGFTLTILMNLFGSFIIYWLFGAAYAESVAPAQILFLSIPFLFTGMVANIVANAIHQERGTAVVLFVAVLVNVGLNLFAIPKFGISGAAWVTLISQTILTLGMFLLVMPKLISPWKYMSHPDS